MRLIDADKVSTNISWMTNINALMKIELDKQPTVDAEPVVHAHWDERVFFNGETPDHDIFCSHCGSAYGDETFSYCPFCGAKMDEEAEN